MKSLLRVALNSRAAILLLALASCSITSAQNRDSSCYGNIQVKTIASQVLGETRTIYIRTPEKMNKYDRYPVLYLFDAEVHMKMVTGQVSYLESYKLIPELIVVGITNSNRMRDLTPLIKRNGEATSQTKIPKGTGGGQNFFQFIREEVTPYIDQHYQSHPFKILYGHSLGGLMGIYSLIERPDEFNAYIAVSPSLQWQEDEMLSRLATKLKELKVHNKVLFFSDANEDAHFHSNQLKLDSILKTVHEPGFRFQYKFYPEENHVSVPVKGFYEGLRFVYEGWHLPYSSSSFRKTLTSDTIINHYERLSAKYGFKVIPSHDEIVQVSRFLRNDSSRIQDAIKLLRINRANYPGSPVVLELLGDILLQTNNKKEALDAYRKAASLDPVKEAIRNKIKNLQ